MFVVKWTIFLTTWARMVLARRQWSCKRCIYKFRPYPCVICGKTFRSFGIFMWDPSRIKWARRKTLSEKIIFEWLKYCLNLRSLYLCEHNYIICSWVFNAHFTVYKSESSLSFQIVFLEFVVLHCRRVLILYVRNCLIRTLITSTSVICTVLSCSQAVKYTFS